MGPNLATVRDYLRVIFRRKAFLLAPIVVSILFILPIWVIVPPTYRAVAYVKRKNLAVVAAAPSTLISRGGTGVSLPTLRVEILTWNRLERVIKQLKLDVDLHTAAEWQKKYEELQKHITINASARSPGIAVIQIAATDTDPQRAQQITNAIADNYVEESKRVGREDTEEYVAFLEKNERDYLAKLRKTEGELDKFRQKRFAELPDVKSGILQKLLQLRTTERSHKLQLTQAENRLAELEKQLAEVPVTVKAESTSRDNPAVIELERKLAGYEKALEHALTVYQEAHPDVKRMRSEVERFKAELAEMPRRLSGPEKRVINPNYQQLMMDRMTLKQKIRAHKAALAQTQSWIAANEEDIRKVVKEEKHYTDLVRQKQEHAEFYHQFRRQLVAARSRLQAEAGEYGTEVSMISRAYKPAAPWRLDRIKIALACLGAGFALGVGLMFTVEFCDQSLRSVEDAASFLEVPVLGSILTIVTPEETAQRKRRRMLLVGLIIAAIVVALLGLLLREHYYPGSLQKILDLARKLVG